MKILYTVYLKIQETLGSEVPEAGGILFSSDGGETITDFVYDDRGSKTGTAYTPNTEFVNESIKKYRDMGKHFVGMVHSHPYGHPEPSSGACGGGYTASDYEAFRKLLNGMVGTLKLYFPIVQSRAHGGTFSMRMFYAEKRQDGKIRIGEEAYSIESKSNDARWEREYADEGFGCEKYRGLAVMIVGVKNAFGYAEKLIRSGVSNFILVDSARYEKEDMKRNAPLKEVGGYVVDSLTRKLKNINPSVNIRIIRKDVDQDLDPSRFERWLDGYDSKNVIVCDCSDDKESILSSKELAGKYNLKWLKVKWKRTHLEAFAVNTFSKKEVLLKRYKASEIVDEQYKEVDLNRARADATLILLNKEINEEYKVSREKINKKVGPNKWDSLYSLEDISKKTVVVVGCGGSGSYVENLARSGVSRFVLIDGDVYSKTNIQTQMAYLTDVGKNKALVLAQRLKQINPSCETIVKQKMLDENVSDEEFARWVGQVIYEHPEDVLIAGCTDNFKAQARCSRLGLKYGSPYLQAGIVPGGRVLEIVFYHPEVSKACPRCFLKRRYDAHLQSEQVPSPASSAGTSIFFTEELNAKKGFISLSLLLYHTDADSRYSNFLDENRWVTHNSKHVVDRNFMFYTMDSNLEKNSGIKAYKRFDDWGKKLGSKYQVGVCYFIKNKPKKGCPDCGGKGDLSKVKGQIADTREGIYY